MLPPPSLLASSRHLPQLQLSTVQTQDSSIPSSISQLPPSCLSRSEPPDSFPSSAAFDLINDTLKANPKEREAAIKAAQGIFAFTLTNEAGATESWYLDFKKDGVACKGAAPEGGKADVTLVLSEKDFAGLVAGTANAQRLFMGGKLKIRGNAMKAMKIEPILSKAKANTGVKAKL
ncbi:hypothetical protein TRV_00517 [Trichophyton verrucosum HKI 0517]|uniref:SCP2 domain-containing protein n=1 Tax=Trichophyton verrucosum (strain HKI 0517) TaxID=663202 RepID=D4D0C2_TRIVH|nr:uncharacterized protein TRV_00517 [Trichophyton verrucosum HKI 0517]EFE44726.1 hypothetical protein TRV_00517 [Trichophyton verrucosum HKI 0517]